MLRINKSTHIINTSGVNNDMVSTMVMGHTPLSDAQGYLSTHKLFRHDLLPRHQLVAGLNAVTVRALAFEVADTPKKYTK